MRTPCAATATRTAQRNTDTDDGSADGGNVSRVRFPPSPPKPFELIGELCLKRRRIWRRLCVPLSGSTIKRCDKFVELDLICVELRGVDARVAHKPGECTNVASRLRRLHSPKRRHGGRPRRLPDATLHVSRPRRKTGRPYSTPVDVSNWMAGGGLSRVMDWQAGSGCAERVI